MLKEGVVAPDFSAVLDDGQRFQLSAYKGEKNVVLYFYPRNFTPGCTRQACLFRDNYGGLDAYDAILVGISNNTADSHVRFRVKYKLPFPLIADPDKKLIELYDAKGPLGLLTARVTYVIDKVGVIRRVLRHDFAVNRHWPETRDALSALKNTGQPTS
ncbi:MAG: peroxiredoxin [Elusimicrobia bacterium]|nr:peroxiredoxin [Elusimicrobiota bacterium]MBK7545658.1 peroxiredoxin [Elusimicrobiota bacterium]MBK7574920.1 peroxiredoxin [Elusimicrobiota bacterium]MBK7687427.1 peroxiredoxin [Elusimicrobiota bacterium]MBK8125659.1 peroxiredoxin [Elusimicrobiota bacterium]